MATISIVVAVVCPTMAANNQATGDIAGDSAALQDSNVFVLLSTGSQLAVVKRAFLPDGTVVADASTLPNGSSVHFLVYISNDTALSIHDVSLQDVLDAAFTYQTTSIRVDNSIGECAAQICNAAEELAVFNAVRITAPLNDGVDADVGSYTAGSLRIDVGNQVLANGQLNLAANSVWAMLITVTVQ